MDRVDDFFEVALVLVKVDRIGVVGAEAGVGPLHELCADLFVGLGLVHKVPSLKGFVGEKDRAFGAGELHAGGVPVLGPGAGAAFDDAACAVFKFDDGDGDVFDLDVGVCETGSVGLHGFYGSREIEQSVNRVNGLIHQCATAVECPGAAPAG